MCDQRAQRWIERDRKYVMPVLLVVFSFFMAWELGDALQKGHLIASSGAFVIDATIIVVSSSYCRFASLSRWRAVVVAIYHGIGLLGCVGYWTSVVCKCARGGWVVLGLCIVFTAYLLLSLPHTLRCVNSPGASE